jgi:hypothetical protein
VESGTIRGPEVDVPADVEDHELEDETAAIVRALSNDEDDADDELYNSEEEWYEGGA